MLLKLVQGAISCSMCIMELAARISLIHEKSLRIRVVQRESSQKFIKHWPVVSRFATSHDRKIIILTEKLQFSYDPYLFYGSVYLFIYLYSTIFSCFKHTGWKSFINHNIHNFPHRRQLSCNKYNYLPQFQLKPMALQGTVQCSNSQRPKRCSHLAYLHRAQRNVLAVSVDCDGTLMNSVRRMCHGSSPYVQQTLPK